MRVLLDPERLAVAGEGEGDAVLLEDAADPAECGGAHVALTVFKPIQCIAINTNKPRELLRFHS